MKKNLVLFDMKDTSYGTTSPKQTSEIISNVILRIKNQ